MRKAWSRQYLLQLGKGDLLLEAPEPAPQLGDPGRRVFDGLGGTFVRDLDGRGANRDLLVAPPQPSQRASRSSVEITPLMIFLRRSLASVITSLKRPLST